MNRKYIFIIGLLLLIAGLLSYFLYEDSDDISANTQKSTKYTNNIILDNPNKSLNKATLNQNMQDLKKMLSKTQNMLKTHNINNPNRIISNNEIDKLVNLDLEHIKNDNKIINNTLINIRSEKEKETINNINKEKNKNTDNILTTQNTQSSSEVTYTSNSSPTPIENEIVEENEVVITDDEVQIEVTKLKTQIADVKKIIEKISSNIQ